MAGHLAQTNADVMRLSVVESSKISSSMINLSSILLLATLIEHLAEGGGQMAHCI
jgi:hypothetical protein